MSWLRLIPSRRRRAKENAPRSARPRLEELESRLVMYSASGNAWPAPQLVTISFVPDGTVVGSHGTTPVTSNLYSKLNARFGSASAWQSVVLRAAQSWAQQANVNFAVVTDDGSALGSGLYQQGDPAKGDIRIGGHVFGNGQLATAYLPPTANNYSIAGDFLFNTGQAFNNGTTYDLFTVAAHEFGHVLGLNHSGVVSSVMYSAYNGTKSALASDDVSGIRAIYGARQADAYDAGSGNGTFATASDITPAINPATLTGVISNLDITSTSDADFYLIKGNAPTSTGKLTLQVTSAGLSLLAPKVVVYAEDQTTVVATATGSGQTGSTLSVTIHGVGQGKQFYVKVTGANTTAFGTGAYAITLNAGNGPNPTVTPPNTQLANGNPIRGGGGQAVKFGEETLVNTFTSGSQQVNFGGGRELAMDANGNFVVVWNSAGQDGNGQGVYAQRFAADGTRLGGEFRVNTTTAGNQTDPAVAMSADGSFVVVWTSQGQEPGGKSWGIIGRRYDAAGNAISGEFLVNTTTAGNQTSPTIAMAADGAFTVVWESQDTSSSMGAYGQRFNAAGQKVGGEFRVNTTTAGDQNAPTLAMAPDGAFVVTWSSNGQDGSGWGVYAQRFDTSGNKVGGELRVNTTTAGDQRYSSVAVGGDGQFVVTWSSNGQDGSGWGIYGQLYDAAGQKVGGEFRVTTTTAGDQNYSSVAMNANGDFVVTWSSLGQDLSGWGAYGQQYTANGVALADEFQVQTTTANDQKYTTVAMDSRGHMAVVWAGNGAYDDAGVYMQVFDVSSANLLKGAHSDSFDPDGCDDHDHQDHHDEDDHSPAGRGPAASAAPRGSAPVRGGAALDWLGGLTFESPNGRVASAAFGLAPQGEDRPGRGPSDAVWEELGRLASLRSGADEAWSDVPQEGSPDETEAPDAEGEIGGLI